VRTTECDPTETYARMLEIPTRGSDILHLVESFYTHLNSLLRVCLRDYMFLNGHSFRTHSISGCNSNESVNDEKKM
jgi:hypothetical protein